MTPQPAFMLPGYELYRLKTNYHKPFVDEVRSLGEMAEIVSPKELEIAMMSGFPIKDIIYNGVLLYNAIGPIQQTIPKPVNPLI